ncbi:hypothetical protein J3E64_003495 [Sphingobium sp. OAS761]|uniref:SMP-30/gluconolactonase/LRE family protein n=1 Tax=Sphingobium sp. OAS761 TaxID=2817901 RepID=UPI00209CF0A4|nr:SMP-30/gluconolactonase/LRE family protein [Sphingobium sp. OAS761]MCP1471782.1 hypothetical protein [Sphingobium sp. OAS761]
MNAMPVTSATQFKRYRFRPDQKEAFLAVWREIARVRQQNGFTIPFALLDERNGILNWAVSHPDFAAGSARYYADPDRKRVSRTDYDAETGLYSNDESRAGPHNIEDYILSAEIDWVTPEAIPSA